MTNTVPPAEHRAQFRNLSDHGSKTWRDGCLALCKAFPRYQTRIHAKGVKGGHPSGLPNYMHILGAARKCGHEFVTDANVAQVLADVAARAQQLYPAVLPGQMTFADVKEG